MSTLGKIGNSKTPLQYKLTQKQLNTKLFLVHYIFIKYGLGS